MFTAYKSFCRQSCVQDVQCLKGFAISVCGRSSHAQEAAQPQPHNRNCSLRLEEPSALLEGASGPSQKHAVVPHSEARLWR